MKSNVRLGRGLGALLKGDSGAMNQLEVDREIQSVTSVSNLPVKRVRPNRFQPRKVFDKTSMEELKASVRENGLIQPITVRKAEGEWYELVSGERRLRALSELGYEKIPAYVLDVADTKLLELALTENVQREDLNPMEIAAGYQRLIDECNLTQEQVSQKVGKDRATVANFLRLLRLPGQVQKSLASGEISVGHARALLALENPNKILNLFEKIVGENLSVRQVEMKVREILGREGADKYTRRGKSIASTRANDSNLSALIERLQRHLGTKVKVIRQSAKSGEIRIEFYSDDDLGRVIEIILTQGER